MTLANLEPTVEYAVINCNEKIVYQSNDLELAKARRDKINPQWSVIELTITYRKVA